MQLEVTWLGHSTVVLDLDGVRLISDPLLRRNAGVLRRRGSGPEQTAWHAVDAVLLSHLHHDHAELASLRLLAGVPVLATHDSAAWLRRKGLDGQEVAYDTWTQIGSESTVRVKLAPAVHGARPMPHRPNAASGHVVESRAGTVWVAGDTELFPALVDLPASAGGSIDVAIVPVGGWGPRLSKGHMGPQEAAVACRMVRARWAIPVHWGTFHVPGGQRYPKGWLDHAGPAFAAALAQEHPSCRAVVLAAGDSVNVADPV